MDNTENNLALGQLETDVNNLQLSTRIENTLRRKVDSGQDLTDEEIFIAVETIGNIFVNNDRDFKGFGFESYEGKKITQKQKSIIALEAIEKFNKEELENLKTKYDNLNEQELNFQSVLTGSLDKIKEEANEILNTIKNVPDSEFGKKEIDDTKVQKITYRGLDKTPATSYKDILKAVEGSLASLDILSRVANYESTGSGKDSIYDLSKLAKDMNGKIIKRENGKVTYDINKEKLCGLDLTITVPDNSDSNYIMRNLKANFVVDSDFGDQRAFNTRLDHKVKPLNKKEALEVLNSIIKFVDKESKAYSTYYNEAKLKLDSFKYLVPIVGHNKLIFRAKINNLNTIIHYLNLTVLRGLMTWVLKSFK